MNVSQSRPTPAPGQRPKFTDWPWLLAYCARGLFELIRARLAFTRFKVKDIPARNARSKVDNTTGQAVTSDTIERISYVLPRLSDRLPWRSDCLVQAIAGQNWLRSLNAASEIQIGVEHPEGAPFAAHAWLVHAGTIVTGGEVEQYEVILSDSRLSDKKDPSRDVNSSK